MAGVDGRFALFDGEGGSELMLSEYRRVIQFDGNDDGGVDRNVDLALVFEEIEAASAHGECVVLTADHALGACFESAFAVTLGCPK